MKPFRRDYQFTPHFHFAELTTTSHPVDNRPTSLEHMLNLMKLAHVLEHFRKFSGPLLINSAFRTPELNRLVKGHPNSFHMLGLAADVRSNKYTSVRLLELFRNHSHPLYKIEFQLYPTFVHLEIVS